MAHEIIHIFHNKRETKSNQNIHVFIINKLTRMCTRPCQQKEIKHTKL